MPMPIEFLFLFSLILAFFYISNCFNLFSCLKIPICSAASSFAAWPPRCRRHWPAAPTPRETNRLRWPPPHGQCQPPLLAEREVPQRSQSTAVPRCRLGWKLCQLSDTLVHTSGIHLQYVACKCVSMSCLIADVPAAATVGVDTFVFWVPELVQHTGLPEWAKQCRYDLRCFLVLFNEPTFCVSGWSFLHQFWDHLKINSETD